jgi:NAD(P)-dependent dehydrogenase (short-subunit alcohol dehydrogenase family)
MARIFITGSSDGLGLAAPQSLSQGGHDVVLHARSNQRAAEAESLLPNAAAVVVGDLSLSDNTRSVAEQVNALGRMDAVIHNAGIYTMPARGSTADGHAVVFAVNTLAPYILTGLINRPRRLVYLSSSLHRSGEGSLPDLDWTQRKWDPAKAYAESKLHVAALAAALARLWPDVLSNAVDPGWVRTKMGGRAAPIDLATGQRTQSWLAASDNPRAQVSGGYWYNLQQQNPAHEVTDPVFQNRLLIQLRELTGVALV